MDGIIRILAEELGQKQVYIENVIATKDISNRNADIFDRAKPKSLLHDNTFPFRYISRTVDPR